MEQYKLMGSGKDVRIKNYSYRLFNDVDIIKRIKINISRWAGHAVWRESE
jgi:hypothetical protein